MAILRNVGKDVRFDPILGYNFLITLMDTSSIGTGILSAGISLVTDVLMGGFNECSGLEMSLKVESYEQGGDNGRVLKFPSRVEWTDITLKKGVGFASSASLGVSISLWDWFYGFVEGKGTRRDGIIVLQNELRIPHNVWFFRQGLPTKYSGPSLNAMTNTVAIEAMVISHQGLYQLPFVSEAAAIATPIASALAK